MGLFTTAQLEGLYRETGGVQAESVAFDGDGKCWGHLKYRAPDNVFFEEAQVYGARAYFTCPYGRFVSEPVAHTEFTIDGKEYYAVGPGMRSEMGSKITIPLGDR